MVYLVGNQTDAVVAAIGTEFRHPGRIDHGTCRI